MSFCEPRSIVTHNFRLVFPSVFPFLGDGGSGPTLLASLGTQLCREVFMLLGSYQEFAPLPKNLTLRHHTFNAILAAY